MWIGRIDDLPLQHEYMFHSYVSMVTTVYIRFANWVVACCSYLWQQKNQTTLWLCRAAKPLSVHGDVEFLPNQELGCWD